MIILLHCNWNLHHKTPIKIEFSPDDVLYVASTRAKNDVPSVASLSLKQDRLFEISVESGGIATEIKMERDYIDVYE